MRPAPVTMRVPEPAMPFRSPIESVDHIRLPQRPIAVERHHHQVCDQLLQCGAVAGRGQRPMVHVVLEREVWIVLPPRRAQRHATLGDALAKAGVAFDQALLPDPLDTLPVDRLVEQQHRVDYHQVRRPIHVQPRGVGARQTSAHHRFPCEAGPSAVLAEPALARDLHESLDPLPSLSFQESR
jgi:hypothetical protein